jgi:hypothetical protein
MHALPEVGHQVAEGTHLPALVEAIETLRDAVIRGGDLVRVDGVELLPRNLRVPEDERAASNQVAAVLRPFGRLGRRTNG